MILHQKKSSVILRCLSVFFILASQTYAQNITFEKSYGGGYSWPFGLTGVGDIIQAPDSGFMISAYYATTPVCAWSGPTGAACILKTDKFGNMQWIKNWQSNLSCYNMGFPNIFDYSANKYILTGNTFLNNGPFGYTYYGTIFQMDSSGNNTGGRLLVGGRMTDLDTLSNGFAFIDQVDWGSNTDISLSHIDSSCALVWKKIYYNPFFETPTGIKTTNDNGSVIFGFGYYNGGNTDRYLLLMKVDSSGNIQWHKQLYSLSNSYVPVSIVQLPDSNLYVLAKIINPNGTYGNGFIIIKTDISGNILFCRCYYAQGGSSLSLTKNNNLLIGGNCLINMDLNGNVIWGKDYAGYAISTSDNSAAILRYMNDTVLPLNNIILIKTDSLGNSCNPINSISVIDSVVTLIDFPTTFSSSNSTCSPLTLSCSYSLGSGEETHCLFTGLPAEEENTYQHAAVFPNPFTDRIDITVNTNQPLQIRIYDITSRELIHEEFIHSISLNTKHLAKGIYVYRINGKNEIHKKGKLVKQ